MKARKLIGGITLEPEPPEVLGHAFDEAWQEIQGNFGSDPREIKAARLKLANAFLSVPHGDLLDPQIGLPQSVRNMSSLLTSQCLSLNLVAAT